MRSVKLTKVENIFEISKRIQKVTSEGRARAGTSIVDGLTIGQAPCKSGYFELSVEQLLSILVEPAHFNPTTGKLHGYQRGLVPERSRSIARAMLKGEYIHPPLLGYENGRVFADDGKHRIVGAVMAGKPLKCVIEPMSEQMRARVYASQSFQVKISRDNLVFAKQNTLAQYCKAAIEAKENGTNHPWRGIIDMAATSDSISLSTAYALIGTYCMEILSSGSGRLSWTPDETINKSFNKADADQLAELVRIFGTKKTHPLAFHTPYLHALVDVAILVKRQQGMSAANISRWIKHMPSFNFEEHQQIAKRSRQMRHFLILHWNKRLKVANKITEDTDD